MESLFCTCDCRRRRPGTSWVWAGVLLLFLLGTQSCATQKIAEGRFVYETKGYAFTLPPADWEIDKDAWVYEREFGHVVVKKRESKYVLRRNRRNPQDANDIQIRPRRSKTIKKLILDMDVGFQHKTQPMQLLIGTISEGNLIKFLKGGFIKTDSDLPENLIAGYLQRLQLFYPPRQPALITSRNLLHAGLAHRLEWHDEQGIRVLYGIALTREYLLISLQADKKTSPADLKVGLQDLDRLVEACVRLQKN
jgi:hypothetical protein